MITRILQDGQKNCSVLVKGFTKEDFEPIPFLDITKLQAPREGWKGFRLDSAVWAIQEKMGLHLWWSKPEGEEELVLPMESRNGIRFDTGLVSPRVDKGWGGVMYISSFRVSEIPGPKSFMFVLELDKQ